LKLHLDHIAILTRCLSKLEASLPVELGRLEVDTFPGEGTKEQYIDLASSGRPSLLLIESIGDGPYRRALQKRGAGLHHFGFVTDSMNDAVDYFSKQGLLLHPISLKTLDQGVVWMCRPGIPFLVEIAEVEESEAIVSSPVSMAIPGLQEKNIDWLPDLSLSLSDDTSICISIDTVSFRIIP